MDFVALKALLFSLTITLTLLGQSLEEPLNRSLYGEQLAYVAPVSRTLAFYEGVRTDKVKSIIKDYFPENYVVMQEIAICESNLRGIQSEAVYSRDRPEWNVKANESEKSYGIYQIHDPLGIYDKKRLLNDHEYNIKIARKIYDKQGIKAWLKCSEREHIKNMLYP